MAIRSARLRQDEIQRGVLRQGEEADGKELAEPVPRAAVGQISDLLAAGEALDAQQRPEIGTGRLPPPAALQVELGGGLKQDKREKAPVSETLQHLLRYRRDPGSATAEQRKSSKRPFATFLISYGLKTRNTLSSVLIGLIHALPSRP